MGTWGPGLYANDLARDLKPTVSTVTKLPLDPAELITLLKETFPQASNDKDDEDHSSFWLVLADQFHKQAIDAPEVFERAREIIESGSDLNQPGVLEMSPADQKKRAKALQVLGARIANPPAKKARKTLKKPQPLLMQAGDLFVFPLFAHGNCINPYFAKWTHQQEAWGAVCIVRSHHVFDYLAVYHPLVIATPFELAHKPMKDSLLKPSPWNLRRPGTCSKLHLSRMQLDLVGNIPIDESLVAKHFPQIRDGRYQAVNDISIADSLTGVTGVMGNDGQIEGLRKIISR